jgi:hypothetical protein
MAHIKIEDSEVIRVLSPMMDKAEQLMREKSQERIRCFQYYQQDPYGNERQGWSQTVASTVFDVIEWLKPGLNEIFTSPDFFTLSSAPKDDVIPTDADVAGGELTPEGTPVEKDNPRKRSEDLKEYLRYILFRAQDGEDIIDDFIADCLLYHNGVFKVYYAEDYDTTVITRARMEKDEFAELQADPDITISKYTEVQEFDKAGGYYWEGVEDVKAVKNEILFAGPRVEVIPPWEFYTLPGTKAINRKTKYVEHRVKKTLADIKIGEEQGRYKKGSHAKVEDKLGQRVDYYEETNDEKTLVYSVENLSYEEGYDTDVADPSSPLTLAANEVYVREIYARLDVDNDGLLEPVIITVCEKEVLQIQDNPYKRPPFRVGSVYRQPHRLEGKPLPLVLEDDQKELTNLHRLMTDASAESAYGTMITDDVMLASDWTDRQVGDVLIGQYDRFKEIRPKPPGRTLLDAIEKREAKVEQKSGVSRYNQGIDANSLNKTATGISLIQTAGQARQKFTAKRLGRTLKLVLRDLISIVQKWPPDDVVQVVGTDININPDDLGGKYEIEIDVGVGPQDRVDQAHHLDALIGYGTEAGIAMGIMGPEHIIRALKRKGKLVGTPYHDLLLDEKQFNVVQDMQQQMQQMAEQLEMITAQYEQLSQQGMPPLEHIIQNMPQLIEGRAKQVAGEMLQPHSPDGPKGGSNVESNQGQPSTGQAPV